MVVAMSYSLLCLILFAAVVGTFFKSSCAFIHFSIFQTLATSFCLCLAGQAFSLKLHSTWVGRHAASPQLIELHAMTGGSTGSEPHNGRQGKIKGFNKREYKKPNLPNGQQAQDVGQDFALAKNP